MIYLVKISEDVVELFTSKPTKVKHHYLIDSDEEEQDYHGHFYKVQIESEKYFERLEDADGKKGITLNITNFSNRTMEQLEYDKPLKIN